MLSTGYLHGYLTDYQCRCRQCRYVGRKTTSGRYKINCPPTHVEGQPQHKHKIKHDKTTMPHLLFTFVNVPFSIYSHT